MVGIWCRGAVSVVCVMALLAAADAGSGGGRAYGESSGSVSTSALSWGWDGFGQTGDPSFADRRVPEPVGEGLPAGRSVAVGLDADYEVSDTGHVWAWGSDAYGQLGQFVPDGEQPLAAGPLRSRPERFSQPTNAVSVVAEAGNAFALTSKGTVWAWGPGIGEGTGNTTADAVGPVRVPGLQHVVGLSAGGDLTLALLADGTVEGWGSKADDELGSASQRPGGSGGFQLTPVVIPGLPPIREVIAGSGYGFAIDTHGGLWAWGDNSFGQLGLPRAAVISQPTRVPGIPALRTVATTTIADYEALSPSTLAVTTTGQVWAWGADRFGQTGNGVREARSTPHVVAGLSHVATIAVGDGQSVAATSGGGLWAWGRDDHGQLGDGSVLVRSTPEPIADVRGVTALAAGGEDTIALAPAQALPAPPGVITFEGAYQANDGPHPLGQLSLYEPFRFRPGYLAVAGVATQGCAAKITPPAGWTLLARKTDHCYTQWTYDQWIRPHEPRLQPFHYTKATSEEGAIVLFYGVARHQAVEGIASAATAMAPLRNDHNYIGVRSPTVNVGTAFSESVNLDYAENASSLDPVPLQDVLWQVDLGTNADMMTIAADQPPRPGPTKGVEMTIGANEQSRAISTQLLLRPARALRRP
jgi:alpha-tubulin suppressor-like RCC1 family protein